MKSYWTKPWASTTLGVIIFPIAAMPLTGAAGFVIGVLFAACLGGTLHDNYEYFSPSYGQSWEARAVGLLSLTGGASIGFALPWLLVAYLRRSWWWVGIGLVVLLVSVVLLAVSLWGISAEPPPAWQGFQPPPDPKGKFRTAKPFQPEEKKEEKMGRESNRG